MAAGAAGRRGQRRARVVRATCLPAVETGISEGCVTVVDICLSKERANIRAMFKLVRPFNRPIMSRSTPPALDGQRATKRQKLAHLTPDSFKNGVFLAPMVRSGALPTRLTALKHGATLVWGPEIVDKAILHTERVVDRKYVPLGHTFSLSPI